MTSLRAPFAWATGALAPEHSAERGNAGKGKCDETIRMLHAAIERGTGVDPWSVPPCVPWVSPDTSLLYSSETPKIVKADP